MQIESSTPSGRTSAGVVTSDQQIAHYRTIPPLDVSMRSCLQCSQSIGYYIGALLRERFFLGRFSQPLGPAAEAPSYCRFSHQPFQTEAKSRRWLPRTPLRPEPHALPLSVVNEGAPLPVSLREPTRRCPYACAFRQLGRPRAHRGVRADR